MNRRCLNCMEIFEAPEENINYICPYCGFIENTPPGEIYHLYPGIILQDRYTIGTVLGFGGFGITYKAWDNVLNSVVAIKEYYPSGSVQRVPGTKTVIVYQGSKRQEYFSGLSRFLDEARNMAKFHTNPHIVQVDNFFEENNTAYIVMEYLDGISLKGYLKQEFGKIDCNTAVEIILSIIDALKDIHKEGIIHRDISPDNIFLCQGNKIKLIDFGAARFSDEEKEITRSIILKPGFAPTEQYQSKSKQGPWTDIYALSATLYNMVTGVVPDESVNRVIEDTVKSPRELDENIPDNLSKTIMRGMALNHELRFQNVEELEKALKNEIKVTDPNEELKKRKHKRFIGVTIAACLIIGGGFYALNMYKKKDIKLSKAEVSVWVSYDEDKETVDEKREMVEQMVSGYMKNQPNVSLDIEVIEKDDYSKKLEEAYEEGNMPVLYQSDDVSDDILDNAVTMEEFYKTDNYKELDENDCYFIFDDKYKGYIKDGKQMPLGFCVPVAYVRRSEVVDIDTVEITSFEQIRGDDKTEYYIMPKYYGMIINTFGGNIDYDNGLVVDDTAQEYIDMIDNDENGYDIASDTDAIEVNSDFDDKSNEMMKSFSNGDIEYFLASTREFKTFNSNVAGLYEMRPIKTGAIYGEFTDMYSIDKSATKEEQEAAFVLLRYLLDDSAQQTLHIQSKSALPLNKSAYEQFVQNSGKYEIVDDYIDEGIIFNPANQRMIDKEMEESYE